MKLLLTGSSGYIGSRLAQPLMEAGNQVIGIDRRDSNGRSLDAFHHDDLNTTRLLAGLLSGIDTVFHLAAAKDDWGLTDEEYFRDNYDATKVLVEAGRRAGVKRWVFYSSVSAMGPSDVPLDESALLRPNMAYGASKAQAEMLFHEWAAEDPELEVLIIRPSVVFGPGNPDSTNIFRLIDAIYRRRFVMIGKGDVMKTTSHLENLIAATMFGFERLQPGVKTYIYVDEPVWETRRLVEEIYALLGKKQPSFYLPLGVARPLAYASDVAATLTRIDFPITGARIRKFCTATNFDASAIRRDGFVQPVSMSEALTRTVDWYLFNRNGKAPARTESAMSELA